MFFKSMLHTLHLRYLLYPPLDLLYPSRAVYELAKSSPLLISSFVDLKTARMPALWDSAGIRGAMGAE